ncbi:MAG: response regulator [Desulfovibrio sp.]
MRALIAEDEFMGRKILLEFIKALFEVDIVVNGKEAVDAFILAHKEGKPYDVIFMDIMMPIMDGVDALEKIRSYEETNALSPKTKTIMTTAVGDAKTIIRSFHDGGASSYLVKPLDKESLMNELRKMEFID